MFKSLEKLAFKEGVLHPWLFRKLLRPIAYARSQGDPERVHDLAMAALNEHRDVLAQLSKKFDSSRLKVHLKERSVMPFGTAAGLDKNGHALIPMSNIFGFLEPGTVVMDKRPGNVRPRVYADRASENVFNAQGFPSDGFELFERNLRAYRDAGCSTPVYVNICGLPDGVSDLDQALGQIKTMVLKLISMADGFVWNPFSPNTEALAALRTPENFHNTAELIRQKGHESHLRLVKMGPFEKPDESHWLELLGAWLEGGGDGAVVVNTYMTPKENIPTEKWGYPTAGISGKFLSPYRQRAIRAARRAFPDAVIIATGGVDSADEAWQAFSAGANALEGYTPYTFHGFGLLLKLIEGIDRRLDEQNVRTLQEYIEQLRLQ